MFFKLLLVHFHIHICLGRVRSSSACISNDVSYGVLFVHNIRFSCPIVLKFCTEHVSLPCSMQNFKKDWMNNKEVMGERDYHKIWVQDEFPTDILYCTAPTIVVSSMTYRDGFLKPFRKEFICAADDAYCNTKHTSECVWQMCKYQLSYFAFFHQW